MEALKPCPACGGEARVYENSTGDYTYFESECNDCHVNAAVMDLEYEAIDAWNNQPRIVELEKRLRVSEMANGGLLKNVKELEQQLKATQSSINTEYK